ncbi:hypothetical protein ACJX0J_022155, partial [Zea mays]
IFLEIEHGLNITSLEMDLQETTMIGPRECCFWMEPNLRSKRKTKGKECDCIIANEIAKVGLPNNCHILIALATLVQDEAFS